MAAHYKDEDVIDQATVLIERLLERAGVSRSELADRLDVSPPQITQTLNYGRDMRLSTLARYFEALGYELKFTAKKRVNSAA